MDSLFCTDLAPSMLGILNFEGIPALLFYSYIPILIFAIVLSVVVYFKSENKLQTVSFLTLSFLFSAWSVLAVLQWLIVSIPLNMFVWQIIGLIEILMFLAAMHFFLVFLWQKQLPLWLYVVGFLAVTPVIFLLPTRYGVEFFDPVYCEGTYNLFFTGYIYAVEIVCIVLCAYAGGRLFFTQKSENAFRKQAGLITLATVSLLLIFTLTSVWGESTTFYEINLFGPLGMVAFLALLTFMMVRYKTFNIKLIATQALVWMQIALIGSQFFFVRNNTNRILTAVTLIVSGWLGLIIVRSVKKEIEARETIEGLAKKLEESNTNLEEANGKLKLLDKQKSEFVSVASHQLRSPLTVIKGYLSMFVEGEPQLGNIDKGTITPKGKEVMQTMFESTNRLAHIIEDFLNVSRIEQGKMKYEMTDFDVRQMSTEVVNEFQAEAGRRKLTIKCEDKSPKESYMVYADAGKIRQVIGNIIDNSIKYTPQGGITVYLERLKESIKISVKDTGIGISPENLKNLFQKFARAANGGKVNVTGSGLGLFVAIEIVKAHGGKMWAESEGEGTGSTFVIELPLKTKVV